MHHAHRPILSACGKQCHAPCRFFVTPQLARCFRFDARVKFIHYTLSPVPSESRSTTMPDACRVIFAIECRRDDRHARYCLPVYGDRIGPASPELPPQRAHNVSAAAACMRSSSVAQIA